MTTASSSLAIRETILGVLRGKDLEGTGHGKIHSSDFRTAVSDLGFPMGSQVVEDILVHCRVDPRDGNIDFSNLEKELVRERRVVNTRVQEEKKKGISSSMGIKQGPWRADVLHREKLQAEKQSKTAGEQRKEILVIYKNFVNSEITAEEVLHQLQLLHIEPTRAFLTLLNHNKVSAEISFSDFIRALVMYDPRNSQGVEHDRPAGALHPSLRPQIVGAPEVDAGLFTQMKRKNPAVTHEVTLTARKPVPLPTSKKISVEIDQKTGGVYGKFKSSTAIQESVFFQGRSQALLSHCQLDQQTGILGESVSLSYTSEQKLLREQVLAALRKFDSGELSLPEFQDKVFDMGFELPEIIVKELQRSNQCGQLDWRKCVEILDAEVFKVKALHERVLPQQVEAAKTRLVDALLSNGANSISNLVTAFRRMDSNGDGALSLNELKAGFNSFGIHVADEDVRILFNACDTSGDGLLQLYEFLEAIRGPVPSNRLAVIRTAFQRLNRTGTTSVPIEMVMDAYVATAHPDVMIGLKSEREVVTELCHTFTVLDSTGCGRVTPQAFEEVFSNLSASVPDYEEFKHMMFSSFGMNERKAAPVLQASRKGPLAGTVAIPKAKQAHGDCITWNQDKSELESDTEFIEQTRRQGVSHPNKGSSVIISPSKKDKTVSPDLIRNEFKMFGGLGVTPTGVNNLSSKSLLSWDTSRKAKRAEDSAAPAVALYSKEATGEDSRGFLFADYHWSPTRTAQYSKPAPFDQDDSATFEHSSTSPYAKPSSARSNKLKGSGTPKSLAEVFASTGGRFERPQPGGDRVSQGPVSLLDLMSNK